jgi:hypothetical protein
VARSGHEQNWLPTPSGKFKLMFRCICLIREFSTARTNCRALSGRSDTNRLISKYGHPITAVILAVFAWVVYRRIASRDEIIPLAIAAVI